MVHGLPGADLLVPSCGDRNFGMSCIRTFPYLNALQSGCRIRHKPDESITGVDGVLPPTQVTTLAILSGS